MRHVDFAAHNVTAKQVKTIRKDFGMNYDNYDNDNFDEDYEGGNGYKSHKKKTVQIISTKTGATLYEVEHVDSYKLWQETAEFEDEDKRGNKPDALRTVTKHRCQIFKNGVVTRIYLNPDVIVIATDEAE